MKVSLFKGLDEEGKKDLKGSFLTSLLFRKSLIKALNTKIDEMRKKTRRKEFILEGDYAQKMAWTMGYEKAQAEFIAFMEEKEIK